MSCVYNCFVTASRLLASSSLRSTKRSPRNARHRRRRRAISHFMKTCVAFLSACSTLSAAGIRGTVVENQTGKSLSRAFVALQPVAGTPGVPVSMRTNNHGAFTFPNLAAGAYVLKVTRRGFVPTEYGQKRWDSAGVPIALGAEDSPFVTIRLPRYGAITGMVIDENDVGLSDHEVVAYRAT